MTLLRPLNCGSLLLLSMGIHAQCTIVEPSTTPTDTVSFSFVGGGFASFGCAPIDPTFWMSGSGMSVTANLTPAMDLPGIRVWGMNSDDVASVSVNGTSYPLDATSAYYTPKVVCGLSPGPDGVVFVSGNVTGANTPVDGNFSYQDVFLNTTGVTSITIAGLTGAGWGFDGILLECATSILERNTTSATAYPNPTFDKVQVPLDDQEKADAVVMNDLGIIVKEVRATDGTIDLSGLDTGAYTILITRDRSRSVHRVVKQ